MTDEIIKYNIADESFEIRPDYEQDTVWMTKAEMAHLFGIDRSGVSRHISKAFKNNELNKKSNVQKMHIPNSDRPVEFFDLDAILYVGYKTDSQRAVQFRKWANRVLKQYLLEGFALNQRKLQEQQGKKLSALQKAVDLVQRGINRQITSLDEADALMRILSDFSQGLKLLDDFDNNALDTCGKTSKEAVKIDVAEFLKVIEKMKPQFGSDVFANPKDDSFNSSVNQIYQTFGGQDCYPTLEEKAAMLLYLITKNHSFSDGNKRIAAQCFLYFLDRNGLLYRHGQTLIENATLAATTVLIAESKPDEMETIKQMVVSILNRNKGGDK